MKAVAISHDLLVMLMTDGYEIGRDSIIKVSSEIPPGSHIVRTFERNNKIYIVFEHESHNEPDNDYHYPIDIEIGNPPQIVVDYPDSALQQYISKIYEMNDDPEFLRLKTTIERRRYFLQKMVGEL